MPEHIYSHSATELQELSTARKLSTTKTYMFISNTFINFRWENRSTDEEDLLKVSYSDIVWKKIEINKHI